MQIEWRYCLFFQFERSFAHKRAGLAVEQVNAAGAVIDEPLRTLFQLEEAGILSVCGLVEGRNGGNMLWLALRVIRESRSRNKPDAGRSIDPGESLGHSKEMVERGAMLRFPPAERQSVVLRE